MKNVLKEEISLDELKEIIIADYRLACVSRETSLMGRREVLTGKAKFGIFGDGKEIAQLAWSKVFKNGDFRSGYYRDQTFMMAIGALSVQELFASLYADTNHENEPASGGRQMNGHFATQSLDEDGNWKSLKDQKNSSPDISPTAAQMPRLLGLAQASKIYRHIESLSETTLFSTKGNEIAWGTIGNASTSEGHFFETVNAAGVLQVPMVISIWDDDYGISVHARHQTIKENISEILKGFQKEGDSNGFEILTAKGWDYPGLIDVYEKAEKIAREQHVPVLIHVREMTQPQGHSTSGSHERYKNEQRLKWESDFDCIKKMREWILSNALGTEEILLEIENEAKKTVRKAKSSAWKNYLDPILLERDHAVQLLQSAQAASNTDLSEIINTLASNSEPGRREIFSSLRKALFAMRSLNLTAKEEIVSWLDREFAKNHDRYSAHLTNENSNSAIAVKEVEANYDDALSSVDARIILRDNFDRILEENLEVLIFGEDAGKIGDVNQGLEGLQAKHGELRVADTGIREATILGQGIGMALRGLRPIAEIQYLDYVLYALQLMSDDLATIRYRTRGRQKAPLIIRTRGHRLEGIWHSGSPMGGIINLIRGIHVLVPRNMTKAAGFYNTLLEADDPGLIIECLNGYRLKEKMPSNLRDIRTPLGVVECIQEGKDITVVTYGSNCRLALEAADLLQKIGISIEIIDVQSLLPFDINREIVEHIKETNRVLFFDEDVEGGASAFMLQQVLEKQGGYAYLDSKPRTLCSKPHRPAYGSDGDYFSKPSSDDLIQMCIEIMHESDPQIFPNWK